MHLFFLQITIHEERKAFFVAIATRVVDDYWYIQLFKLIWLFVFCRWFESLIPMNALNIFIKRFNKIYGSFRQFLFWLQTYYKYEDIFSR